MRPLILATSLWLALTISCQTGRAGDAQKLLVTSDHLGNDEIFLMNVDGSEMKNLTNGDAEELAPAWSPDGKKIAFASNWSGHFNIFVMDADGSNVEQLTTFKGGDKHPAWSPNGKQIAFRRTRI